VNIYTVIGSQFGDEGKGKFVDYLCSQYPNSLVIRYSGGQQAGHKVVTEFGKEHIFSNFGSGSLRGVSTYWSSGCTIDPEGILNELKQLRSINIEPMLFIDPKCPVTTPIDKMYNQTSKTYCGNGTVGAGFGTTLQREEDNYSLLAEDLEHESILKIKLDLIFNYYKNKGIKNDFEKNEYLKIISKLINEKIVIYKPYFNNYENIIFEGSQGLLLDKDIGFFPNVTRDNTGLKKIASVLNNDIRINSSDIFYITRAYQTRHGNGVMSEHSVNIKLNPHEHNKYHKYQGDFRISLLDLDYLLYALQKDNNNYKKCNLVITCLDIIKDYNFVYKEKINYCKNKKEFINKIREIIDIDKIYISESPISNEINIWDK
jgi:adenylosuccinate synthase